MNNTHTTETKPKKSISDIESGTVRETLLELLKKIKRVDFRKKAGLSSHEELTQKHYLVITIEQLIKEARENKWGLGKNEEKLYVYNGTHWQLVNKDDLKLFLGIAARKMGVEEYDAKFYQFRDKLMKQFISTAHLPTPKKPKGVTLINLKNGTFEITPDERKLRDFERSDFLKYQLPFEYNPEAECSMFKEYLNRVLPDKELQKILSEYIGYVFISIHTLKLEKTLILYGVGANGKSVFFDIINALLGKENISNFTLESLTNSTGYQRACISDKLLNYASEISNRMNVDLFKQLVSGEPVEARQIYGKPQMLEDYAKLIFNCNELPITVQHKEAYFRRFIIIPFDQKIPPDEQNPKLAQEIIDNELPGIFNWVLEGLERLLEQENFTESNKVNSVLNKYRTETNSVKHFLNENGIKSGVEKEIHLKEMYNSYKEFCKDEDFKSLGKTNFSNYLQDLGFQKKRINTGMVICTEK